MTRSSIPGRFLATYREGAIVRWTFLPSGADAGYSGPAAVPWYGETDLGLDLDESDGAFWKACQRALGPVNGVIQVSWEE